MRIALRELLPHRRESETFEITHNDKHYSIMIGRYPEGTIGEVFVNGAKSGSEMEAITGDAAVLLSLALQHGIPLPTMRRTINRDKTGKAETIIGAVIDAITEEKTSG